MQYYTFHNASTETETMMQECISWLHLLDSFKQENALLKTKLSELTDKNNGTDFLNEAEKFQQAFITQDEFINEIMLDTKKQLDALNEPANDKKLKQQQKLKNEIKRLEANFNNIKQDFNKTVIKFL